MRIACLHVPQFALQCLTRVDPSLRGAPVAVVSVPLTAPNGLHGPLPAGRPALFAPVVQACSKAAWALGVRLGMTAMAANSVASASGGALRVVQADASLERETVRAIADALLGVSTAVDAGGRVGAGGAHLAVYCEVPSKTRGTSFGDRMLEVTEALGLTARVGIADDRFTAWVAAAHGGVPSDEAGVVSVPRGGSAAFLAPQPLSLLAITPEVQHMLEALGVRTLGEFAALPAPSVARPLEADYQALARGDSGNGLRPYAPEASIREEAILSPVCSGPAALATLAERVALRLRGRGRGASRLELSIHGAPASSAPSMSSTSLASLGAAAAAPVRTAAVTADMAPLATAGSTPPGALPVLDTAEALAEAFGKAVGEDLHTATRLRVTVVAEALAGDAFAAHLAASAGGAHGGDAVTAVLAEGSAPVDVLEVVLATTGALGTWQLTSPASSPSGAATLRRERRDAHRRTRASRIDRRSDRRPARERPVDLVQARLFTK